MMKYYEHTFSCVEDYLHHRAPYLMVDRIMAVGPTWIETEKSISGTEPFLAGHFPGAPVFPGAMMQEACTQSAGILIAAKYNPMEQFNTHDPFFNPYALGVLVRVKRAKFSSFARPGDTLSVRIDLVECLGNVFEFDARISLGNRGIMRATFQLTNVPSATLSQPTA
jgi:3-hydroxyacyl-[acyl-carrier-protein] dehydratase